MRFFYLSLGLFFIWGCQNIEDTPPTDRNTFARFYEDFASISGVVAEPLEDGYLILSNSVNEDDTTGFVIRTDISGKIQWKTPLPSSILTGLKVVQDGYFILGDSIKIDPAAEEISDLVVYSTMLYKVGLSGEIINKVTFADDDTVKIVDIKSNAITINDLGEIIMLGTSTQPTVNAKQRPFVAALDPNTLDTLWVQSYNVIDRDYVNAKSVHTTGDGHVVWASAILKEQQSFERSYLAIPYVVENAPFENNDVYGSTTDQRLIAADMQPSNTPSFGYGVVGSFANPSGDGSNMFFARVTINGNFILGSERFFDAEAGLTNVAVASNVSESEDTGNAITSTQDGGFVLAGSMETTPQRGNGGKDIFIVKVDASGTPLWHRTFGGSSDEEVQSIRETADGGLLICGTKDTSGLPVLFLIKTNKNGEILDE